MCFGFNIDVKLRRQGRQDKDMVYPDIYLIVFEVIFGSRPSLIKLRHITVVAVRGQPSGATAEGTTMQHSI